MKRFNITVNGKAYDVAVEEVTGGAAPVQAAAPAPAPAPVQAAPAPAAAPAAAPADASPVNAPMPGTILEVKVKVGDTVTFGQPIIVLEALKMENDIVAPKDGKIVSINVNKGDSVETNSLLASIQ